MVAQLTLVKSAYRLGETVNGSVMINSGEGRVLRVSFSSLLPVECVAYPLAAGFRST